MSDRIGPRNFIVAGLLFLLPIIAMIILAGNSSYDTERGLTLSLIHI